MKNLLSVFALAMVLLFSANNMTAQSLSQDGDRPEVIAKTKVAELSEKFSLNGDQQRALFRAYTAHYSNYRKHVEGKNQKDAAVVASRKKFDAALQENVKKQLTAEQYKQWLAMQKQ
jgi:hypothetical protein